MYVSGILQVSYDGTWPILCAGTLVMRVNGTEVVFPPHSLISGGAAYFRNNWSEEVVERGKWKVNVPDRYKDLQAEIEREVNKNVPWGCCGGCL